LIIRFTLTSKRVSVEQRIVLAHRLNTRNQISFTQTVRSIKSKAFGAFLDSTVWICTFTGFRVSSHSFCKALYILAVLHWLASIAITFESRWAWNILTRITYEAWIAILDMTLTLASHRVLFLPRWTCYSYANWPITFTIVIESINAFWTS